MHNQTEATPTDRALLPVGSNDQQGRQERETDLYYEIPEHPQVAAVGIHVIALSQFAHHLSQITEQRIE